MQCASQHVRSARLAPRIDHDWTTFAVGDVCTAGNVTVLVHAVVDHTIVEVIFDNRTAIAGTYSKPAQEDSYQVRLFGSAPFAEIQTWELEL